MNPPNNDDYGAGRKRSLFLDNGNNHHRPHQRRHLLDSISADSTESNESIATPIKDRLRPDTIVKITFGSDDVTEPRFVLGYWSIRGLGAPLRAMLSAARVSHWLALYDVQEKGPEGWEKGSFLRDKEWLQKEFDCFLNLPFLVDTRRNIVISQSNAIFSYLGRELRMVGASNYSRDCAKAEEILCEVMDLRNLMVRFAYHTVGGKACAIELMNQAKKHLRRLENHLAKEYPEYFNNMIVCGEGIVTIIRRQDETQQGICHVLGRRFSAADFHLWEMLNQFEALCRRYDLPLWGETESKFTPLFFQSRPDIRPLQDRFFPHLEEFRSNFPLLPENAPYYQSSFLHKGLPFNNPYASFGSDPDIFQRYIRGEKAPWHNKGDVHVSYPIMRTP